MANINSSLDEILTELGDGFDADIAPRKIVRSTGNKIWLMLRAFSRGLYGLYQVVASLKYRFDPLYCTDDELESTMRLVGTTRRLGKASLLSVSIWNNNEMTTKTFPAGTYQFSSANGTLFILELAEDISIPVVSFAKRDFFSALGDAPLPGSFPVSENSNITVTRQDAVVIDTDFSFDCDDNEAQLGYLEESMFEIRQRILTDNQRQEVLHILEERLSNLPNIHECTIIANKELIPVASDYLKDDELTYVQILPQSLLVLVTGSPNADFAKEFVSLCPFITTPAEGVEAAGVVYYDSQSYLDGRFPVHYIPHKIDFFDVVIKYGYSTRQVSTAEVEGKFIDLLRPFKSVTRFKEVISTEEFSEALKGYQNPGIRILDITFMYNAAQVDYIVFKKTQLARLRNITFQQVPLWS